MNFCTNKVKFIALVLVFSAVCNVRSIAQSNATGDFLDEYNPVWTTPSLNSKGSMPLGNGDIGINCWAEKGGVIYLYLSKNDAWDENCRLLKLGKVKINIYPDPFANDFKQTLRLNDGTMLIQSVTGKDSFQLRIWVDANSPAVRIETVSSTKHKVGIQLDNWRKEKRTLNGIERNSAYGLKENIAPIYVYPDTVLNNENQLAWLHYNRSSIWQLSMHQQGLSLLISKQKDPLLNRAFGCAVKGSNFKKTSNDKMLSSEALKQHISIYAYTSQVESIAEWNTGINRLINTDKNKPSVNAYPQHLAWWKNYWNNSYISVSGSPQADTVMRGYVFQRFVAACSSRGKYPNKFNGSLFTVDSMNTFAPYDADFRAWGGPYWLQNTRLIYWPMLASGNFEMMKPFFDMYLNDLNLGMERTKKYFNHDGAFFPETMYFWGAYAPDDFGWNRQGKSQDYVENAYMRYNYDGSIEVAAMMLEYYRYTLDETFLKQKLLPFVKQILLFYDKHYAKEKLNNRFIYHIAPSQSLETYHNVVNPLPVIAGLTWVLDELLNLSSKSISPHLQLLWKEQRKSLPALPMKNINGEQRLVPAEVIFDEARNSENCELYAVFPYRLFGVGKDGLDIAIKSFNNRPFPGSEGWRQDDTQAAYLGMTDTAKQLLITRMSNSHKGSRFAGFWGPNFDWVPDQDHGSNGLNALQTMLVQYVGKKIIVFPSWPKEWDVSFKLHTADRTVIEAVYKKGKIVTLTTMPARRLKDVIISEMK